MALQQTGPLEVEAYKVLIGRMSCTVVSAALMRVEGASVLMLNGLTSALGQEAVFTGSPITVASLGVVRSVH